jgi:hypothetical protein
MPPNPIDVAAMTPRNAEHDGRYWIVGGRYRDASFRHLDWTAPTVGPFARRADAEAACTEIGEAYAAQILVRFTVSEERLAVAA